VARRASGRAGPAIEVLLAHVFGKRGPIAAPADDDHAGHDHSGHDHSGEGAAPGDR
jgi:hypothetical protein